MTVHAAWRRPIDLRAAAWPVPAVAYERIDALPRIGDHDSPRELDDLVSGICEHGGVRIDTLAPPIPFDHPDRSMASHLHGWGPVSRLLAGYDRTGNGRYLAAGVAYAADWYERYQNPLLGLGDPEDALSAAIGDPGQTWNRMVVGQRAYRLAYLLEAVARRPEAQADGLIEKLLGALLFHATLLDRDQFFAAHSNHGLYQALGQLAATRRFLFLDGLPAFHAAAAGRLRSMFDKSFLADGVHCEHSPGYHYMILASLLGARAAGLLPPGCDARLAQADAALAWMICPNGSLAPIGDTDSWPGFRTAQDLGDRHGAAVQYLWSNGAGGQRPASGVFAATDAGYVFARRLHPGEPPSRASYLAQIAGFHSRTHKHADHLSFIWHDHGGEILIDPGRLTYGAARTEAGSALHAQGFWYDDPRRIYIETTRAHNCVEINGLDYPRRRVSPFGSALELAEEQSGIVVTSCATHHFRTIRHWRGLIFSPRKFLLVLDWLYDRSGAGHRARQWFHFSEHVDLRRSAAGLVARRGDMPPLHVMSLLGGAAIGEVIKGQTEPQWLGWRSDRPGALVPSPSFCVSHEPAPLAAFATAFIFGDAVRASPGVANRSFRKARFGWDCDGVATVVEISRTTGLNVVVAGKAGRSS